MNSTFSYTGVSAIVPAYDEQETIAPVLELLMSHPMIDEVIVVNDGSTDSTSGIAHRSGATVIDLQKNSGKGVAMDIGVKRAAHNVILFIDADLHGLTSTMVSELIESITSGEYIMRTLARDRLAEAYQFYIPALVLGGERAMRRELWDMIPAEEKTGFGIELALNFYAKKSGLPVDYLFAPGLGQTLKETKHGLVRGFMERLRMLAQCGYTYCKYFVLRRNALPA